jgi:hypothetical protein
MPSGRPLRRSDDARPRARLQVVDGVLRRASNRAVRLLPKLLLAGLGLTALAGGGLVLFLDAAVRAAVEQGGSAALGVPTHLEGASLSPLRGALALEGLVVENPPGFEERPFLSLRRGRGEVELASLRGDVVRIPLVELEGIEFLLQRREGRSNYGVILEHLESRKTPEESPAETGRQVHAKRLVLRDIRVDFALLPLGGELTRARVTIPQLVLEDLGNSDEGASVAQISARVVEALLQAALQAGGQVLSPALLGDLKQGLGRLGVRAIDLGQGVLGEVGGALESLGESLGRGLEGLVPRKKD